MLRLYLSRLSLALLLLPCLGAAQPYAGVNLALPLITKEPDTLHGYQFLMSYDPDRFQWRKFNLLFDAGIAHFWVNNTPYYTTLTIYSLAPIIRYTFNPHFNCRPYLDLSIGIAYLNHTRFEERNLGIHFSFQDRLGVGTYIGTAERFSVGLHAVHYSNAHLANHNSGVSIPLELDIGYRFPL
ncbi:MAG: hypothetical protein A3E85_01890 [Gammaproteobacteria bacterium RIFCSPHIGHO2_12_FULL_45_12]|nr:MAG: hypothetical protein A3E85_01890 [Gammaproteobacteria bacterium RIFCSPHIGHO2_12_FULL_45_12]